LILIPEFKERRKPLFSAFFQAFAVIECIKGNEPKKLLIFLKKGVDKGKKKCYYNQVVERRQGTLRTE
jgi:hypothetical protein